MSEFKWIEFKVRPKKDGLHDSGYRYLSVVGVTKDQETGEIAKTQLNEWADVIVLEGITYIDAEPDGTIRLICRSGRWVHDGYMGSDADFSCTEPERAVRRLSRRPRVMFS